MRCAGEYLARHRRCEACVHVSGASIASHARGIPRPRAVRHCKRACVPASRFVTLVFPPVLPPLVLYPHTAYARRWLTHRPSRSSPHSPPPPSRTSSPKSTSSPTPPPASPGATAASAPLPHGTSRKPKKPRPSATRRTTSVTGTRGRRCMAAAARRGCPRPTTARTRCRTRRCRVSRAPRTRTGGGGC